MKILLIGNYLSDGQRSMQRFASMLETGLSAQGHEVRRIQPEPVFDRAQRLPAPVRKWLAYLDKFVLFPGALRRAAQWADVVHICDHSNAMYVAALRDTPHVVTCHDLLAVRGALGESTDCPASFTGKILQRWILRSLKRAQMVACVSAATQLDLIRLAGEEMKDRSSVVMLGVAPTMAWRNSDAPEIMPTGFPALKPGRPFLLNVGSNLRRKNRDGALRIFKKVSEQFDCDIIFTGEALSTELKSIKKEIGLNGRVIEVPHPSDAVLEALYNRAFALLYPTKYEGFGWPAIEAQTCGCPVISSRSTSIPEVVGDSALLRAPEDEQGFVTDVLRLTQGTLRAELIVLGFENVKRFTPERMVNDYIEIYRKACA